MNMRNIAPGYLGLLLALPLAAGTVRIIQTNSAGDNVSIIDPVTNKVVGEIRGIEVNHGAAAAPARPRAGADHDVLELLGVAVLHVPLPAGAVGAVDPGLGLLGVAAHRVIDPGRLQAGAGESGVGSHHFVRGLGLHAEVVDRPRLTGALEQDQLQGWLVDGEVGVTGLGLGRPDAEHLGVELDRLVEVGDVESQLQPHGAQLLGLIDERRCDGLDTTELIDYRQ